MLRHINYIEIMILAVHRYSGRPILIRQVETLDIRLFQLTPTHPLVTQPGGGPISRKKALRNT